MNNHEECSRKQTRECRPPTRVIDVWAPGCEEEPYLRHSGEDVREWVTLSHCWGQKSPLQTTKNTIVAHQEALPLNTFPNLFCDAVTITRELGYRYLWIDSICIIQDCEEDRAQEIAQMGEIYKNSVLLLPIIVETATTVYWERLLQRELEIILNKDAKACRANLKARSTHFITRSGTRCTR